MLNVVVSGGTGFIGRSVVSALTGAGHNVTVLARDPAKATAWFEARAGNGARALAWSLEAGPVRDEWTGAVAAADVVVNLAGAGVMDRPWTAPRKTELRRSRIDVTLALAQAMATRSPACERVLVSASAVGIYGERTDDTLLTEEAPRGTDFLAELCVAWEAATKPALDAGVRVVHPRLGIVLGVQGGALPTIVRPFRLSLGGAIGSGSQWVSWIHEQDVIDGLLFAITSPGLSGAYNFVAPRPVTMDEEARTIAALLHTHARARVPAFVVRALLGKGRAGAVLTGQRAASARLEGAGYVFAFEALLPALRALLGAA